MRASGRSLRSRPSKGSAPAESARAKRFCARLVRSRLNKGSAPVWERPRLKVSCDHSLRGNTFLGYKFDNKLPPAQSPKMMIVRERPHSRTELPALRIPFGDPGLPRTECRAHPVLLVSQAFPIPCAHESPSSTKAKETGADEERGRVARRMGGKWSARGRENGYGRKKLDF